MKTRTILALISFYYDVNMKFHHQLNVSNG